MLPKKYIGAYKQVEGNVDGLEVTVKNSLKPEFFNPVIKEQYSVVGEGYTGAVVVLEVDADEVPDNPDSFASKNNIDNILISDSVRKASNEVKPDN